MSMLMAHAFDLSYVINTFIITTCNYGCVRIQTLPESLARRVAMLLQL